MKALTLLVGLIAVAALLPAQANEALARKYLCTTCHQIKGAKTIGPTYDDVAKKYAGQSDAEALLIRRVTTGGIGIWGQVPMPPNKNIPNDDLRAMVKWILSPTHENFAAAPVPATSNLQPSSAPAIANPIVGAVPPNSPPASDRLSIDAAKGKCADLGFKSGTEEFGKCVLQLSK